MIHLLSDPDAIDPRDILSTANLRAWFNAGSLHAKGRRGVSTTVPAVQSLVRGTSGIDVDLAAAGGQEPTYGGASYATQRRVPLKFVKASSQHLSRGSLEWPHTEASVVIVGRFPATANDGLFQLRNLTAGSGAMYLYRYSTEFSFQAAGVSGAQVDVRTGASSITADQLTWVRCDVSGVNLTVSTESGGLGTYTGTDSMAAAMDLTVGSSQSQLYLGRALTTYSDCEIHDCFVMDSPPTGTEWDNLIAYLNREYGQTWTGN